MFRMRPNRFFALLIVLSLLVSLGLAETAATPEPSEPPVPALSLAIATIAPREGDVEEEAAIAAAQKLLEESLGIDARLLTKADFALRLGGFDETPRVAVVTFTSGESASIFTVTLDAQTGAPIRASEFDAACLTTLLYEDLPAAAQATLEPAPEEAVPFPAFLADPESAATHVTQMPTDYEIPMGVYMNGTPVIVTGILAMDGGLMYMGGEAPEGWAQVTIGMQGDFAGISGFVPAHMLNREVGTTAIYQLPQGKLTTDSATQHVSLYKSGSRNSDILGVYREGTTVQVMGRLRDWYHARLGSLTGFVEVKHLAFDAKTEELLNGLLPDAFDSVQPGVEDRYQKYMTAVDELWYKFGDSNDWPLSIKAQYSQLSLDWGFQDGPVNVLPGEGELTQAQAEAIAEEAVLKEFGMTDRDYAKVNARYAYLPEMPDEPEWTFRFNSVTPDKPDCAVTLDKQGKVLSFWQDDAPTKPTAYDPLSDLYMYMGGTETAETAADLSREKAEGIALEVYAEQTGENTQTVLVQSTLTANNTSRWWYVTFMQPETVDLYSFDVVVLSPMGEVAAHTAREQYLESAASVGMLDNLDELEREKGRLLTWSLEDKQQYAPGMWGLPGEDDIPQEQALAIATQCLTDKYGIQESDLANWKPFYRFDITNGPRWIIEFFTDEIIASDILTGYTVTIDAQTGDILESWAPEEQNG